MLRLTIKATDNRLFPDDTILAGAAARGLEVEVQQNLRRKNAASAPPAGFPKTDYYADAADHVVGHAAGRVAAVEVEKEGLALHYEGGTVYPRAGKKALAIPQSPIVAGVWPSEYAGLGAGETALVWPKGASAGFIKDTATDEILWLLVPHATIPADPTVLPTDEALLGAAEAAVWEVMSRDAG